MADSDSIRSASLLELTLNRKTVAGTQDALQNRAGVLRRDQAVIRCPRNPSSTREVS